MCESTEQIDHLRLVRTDGVGPVTYRRLLERYRTPAAALEALPRLARAGGHASALRIMARGDAEREWEETAKRGGRFVFAADADYPPLLGMLDDAPPCLILQGDASLAERRCVAAVGGRNASVNGQRMATQLAAGLAAEVVVVSGLARGIDTAAHQGAMRTGRTIAVIAGGIDQPYPPENTALQKQIAESDLVVTEAPFGTVPQARHFPRRNRIIAGLSLAVVVVEAALRSGSLITARMAQEAGREVFAVPGSPLDPRARGGNDLIRQGAMLVETAADVLENLPLPLERDDLRLRPPSHSNSLFERVIQTSGDPASDHHALASAAAGRAAEPVPPELPEVPAHPASAVETVLALLSPEPTPVDDLVRRCHLSPPVTMAVLLELELAARVETLPGSRVALLPGPACLGPAC